MDSERDASFWEPHDVSSTAPASPNDDSQLDRFSREELLSLVKTMRQQPKSRPTSSSGYAGSVTSFSTPTTARSASSGKAQGGGRAAAAVTWDSGVDTELEAVDRPCHRGRPSSRSISGVLMVQSMRMASSSTLLCAAGSLSHTAVPDGTTIPSNEEDTKFSDEDRRQRSEETSSVSECEKDERHDGVASQEPVGEDSADGNGSRMQVSAVTETTAAAPFAGGADNIVASVRDVEAATQTSAFIIDVESARSPLSSLLRLTTHGSSPTSSSSHGAATTGAAGGRGNARYSHHPSGGHERYSFSSLSTSTYDTIDGSLAEGMSNAVAISLLLKRRQSFQQRQQQHPVPASERLYSGPYAGSNAATSPSIFPSNMSVVTFGSTTATQVAESHEKAEAAAVAAAAAERRRSGGTRHAAPGSPHELASSLISESVTVIALYPDTSAAHGDRGSPQMSTLPPQQPLSSRVKQLHGTNLLSLSTVSNSPFPMRANQGVVGGGDGGGGSAPGAHLESKIRKETGAREPRRHHHHQQHHHYRDKVACTDGPPLKHLLSRQRRPPCAGEKSFSGEPFADSEMEAARTSTSSGEVVATSATPTSGEHTNGKVGHAMPNRGGASPLSPIPLLAPGSGSNKSPTMATTNTSHAVPRVGSTQAIVVPSNAGSAARSRTGTVFASPSSSARPRSGRKVSLVLNFSGLVEASPAHYASPPRRDNLSPGLPPPPAPTATTAVGNDRRISDLREKVLSTSAVKLQSMQRGVRGSKSPGKTGKTPAGATATTDAVRDTSESVDTVQTMLSSPTAAAAEIESLTHFPAVGAYSSIEFSMWTQIVNWHDDERGHMMPGYTRWVDGGVTPIITVSPSILSKVLPSAGSAPLRHANEPISQALLHDSTRMPASLAGSIASMARPRQTASLRKVRHARTGDRYINHYRVLKTLGRGANGKVKLAFDETETRLVAIKSVRRADERKRIGGLTTAQQQYNAFMREIDVMKKLRHRNIVSLYEVIDDPNAEKLYLIMQYVDKGVIAKVQVSENTDKVCEPVPPAQLARYTREILTGLQYLHKHDVVHRDLKPDNILVSKDGHAYLADFGVAETFDTTYRKRRESIMAQSLARSMAMSVAGNRAGGPQVLGTKGTPLFIAPELWDGSKSYGKPVDMWAMGVTLFTLLVGKLPFRSPGDITDATFTPPVPPGFSDSWRLLLEGLLDRDPLSRWTVQRTLAYVISHICVEEAEERDNKADAVRHWSPVSVDPSPEVLTESSVPIAYATTTSTSIVTPPQRVLEQEHLNELLGTSLQLFSSPDHGSGTAGGEPTPRVVPLSASASWCNSVQAAPVVEEPPDSLSDKQPAARVVAESTALPPFHHHQPARDCDSGPFGNISSTSSGNEGGLGGRTRHNTNGTTRDPVRHARSPTTVHVTVVTLAAEACHAESVPRHRYSFSNSSPVSSVATAFVPLQARHDPPSSFSSSPRSSQYSVSPSSSQLHSGHEESKDDSDGDRDALLGTPSLAATSKEIATAVEAAMRENDDTEATSDAAPKGDVLRADEEQARHQAAEQQTSPVEALAPSAYLCQSPLPITPTSRHSPGPPAPAAAALAEKLHLSRPPSIASSRSGSNSYQMFSPRAPVRGQPYERTTKSTAAAAVAAAIATPVVSLKRSTDALSTKTTSFYSGEAGNSLEGQLAVALPSVYRPERLSRLLPNGARSTVGAIRRSSSRVLSDNVEGEEKAQSSAERPPPPSLASAASMYLSAMGHTRTQPGQQTLLKDVVRFVPGHQPIPLLLPYGATSAETSSNNISGSTIVTATYNSPQPLRTLPYSLPRRLILSGVFADFKKRSPHTLLSDVASTSTAAARALVQETPDRADDVATASSGFPTRLPEIRLGSPAPSSLSQPPTTSTSTTTTAGTSAMFPSVLSPLRSLKTSAAVPNAPHRPTVPRRVNDNRNPPRTRLMRVEATAVFPELQTRVEKD